MTDFVTVGREGDVPVGACRCVEVGGRRVALVNLDGTLHAVDDTCTHADASLSEGEVTSGELMCPIHFATFDVRTGACTGPPAYEDLAVHEVRVSGGEIQVRIR
jgi:nitrite reductase/ring-hydroxylating ferredoxin subunit